MSSIVCPDLILVTAAFAYVGIVEWRCVVSGGRACQFRDRSRAGPGGVCPARIAATGGGSDGLSSEGETEAPYPPPPMNPYPAFSNAIANPGRFPIRIVNRVKSHFSCLTFALLSSLSSPSCPRIPFFPLLHILPIHSSLLREPATHAWS